MSAEDRLRFELDYCRECDVCRTLLDYSCMVFPELFRLLDKREETGEEIIRQRIKGRWPEARAARGATCRTLTSMKEKVEKTNSLAGKMTFMIERRTSTDDGLPEHLQHIPS